MPVVMHIPYTFSLFVKSKKATDMNPTQHLFEQASIYRSLVVYIIILKWWLA